MWFVVAAAALTPVEQREDLAVLWEALAHHPARTLYTDAAGLEAARTSIEARLDVDRSPLALWAELSPLVARIGCGHTTLDLPRSILDGATPGTAPFPLDLVVVDGTLHLDPRSHPGGEPIRAIQGVPHDVLLERLRSLSPSDALNPGWADHRIDARSRLWVAAALGWQPSWTVELDVEPPRTLTVDWSDRTDAAWGSPSAPRIERVPVGDGFVVRATFDAFEAPGRFRRRVLRPIERAVRHGARGVLVDLRGNGGGDLRSGAELVALFQEQAWPTYERRAITEHLAHERGWPDAHPDWVLLEDGTVDMGYGDLTPWPAAPTRLDVPLVVLIGGATFSTAADVAAFVARDGLGTLVGTPTGGSGRTQTSQDFHDVHLPHSGLGLHVALHRSDVADPSGTLGPGGPVEPHIHVEPTIDDLRAGRDRAHTVALELFTTPEHD